MNGRRIGCLVIALIVYLPSLGFPKTPKKNSPAITILDQNGRVVPQAHFTSTGQTLDVAVGNGSFTFSPSSRDIFVGDTIKWTWFSSNHNVRSGTPCNTPSGAFCSPSDTNCTANPTSNTGATYSHTFTQAGTYSYYCSVHCGSGMKGTITVTEPFITIASISRLANGHFLILGQTVPNASINIQFSPDLVTTFEDSVPPTIVTADATGAFQYEDAEAAQLGLEMRFYRAVYP